jgi:hypothetical protein
VVGAGSGVGITLEAAALFAAMSALAGATFISFSRARTCGITTGKDASVKSDFFDWKVDQVKSTHLWKKMGLIGQCTRSS